MNDYLRILSYYRDTNDVLDLINDIQILWDYYSTNQYDKMLKHIQHLTMKYSLEAFIWNSINRNQPLDYNQVYLNAENFLRAKGFAMLMQKGYDLCQLVKQDEIVCIEKMRK